MVHHQALDGVRRTVSRATAPARVPLRAAAATWHVADALAREIRHASDPTRPADELGAELEELVALRDQLEATPDVRVDGSTERAQRATRSASAYLDARRARLKRELREMGTGG